MTVRKTIISLVAQTVKRLSTMQETRVRSLGREDPLEKGMATHSSVLAWRIPGMGEPGQRIFPTQGSNPGLLHCRQTLYRLSHQGNTQPCCEDDSKQIKGAGVTTKDG